MDIPANYMMCLNDGCPKAKDCLRKLAYESLGTQEVFLRVLNPRLYDKRASCKYFRSARKTRLAWGLKRAFESVPNGVCQQIKYELRAKFGNAKFYRFCRGEVALNEEDQAAVRKAFAKKGIAEEPLYEHWTEEYDW